MDRLKTAESIDLLQLEGAYSDFDNKLPQNAPPEARTDIDEPPPAGPLGSTSLLGESDDPNPRETDVTATIRRSSKHPQIKLVATVSSSSADIPEGVMETGEDADALPVPPPLPPEEKGKKRPRIVFKQSGVQQSSLKLRLKSKKLKQSTLQKSESKGPYNTRGVKLTGNFLQRSGAEGEEGDESSADDEYAEEEEEEIDEDPMSTSPQGPKRIGTTGSPRAERKRAPAAPKNVSSRQSIMKTLGMRR